MQPTVLLPNELRRCPSCGDEKMRAIRAAHGGGWAANSLQFLYNCPTCDAHKTLETSTSRTTTIVAGLLISAFAIAILIFVHPSLPATVALFIGLAVGGWVAWTGFLTDYRFPVTGHTVDDRMAPIEDEFEINPSRDRKAKWVLTIIVIASLLFLSLEALSTSS